LRWSISGLGFDDNQENKFLVTDAYSPLRFLLDNDMEFSHSDIAAPAPALTFVKFIEILDFLETNSES
jgi:hypothetical protein